MGKVKGNLPAVIRAIKGLIILVTAHRRESFGASLGEMCRALVDIVKRNPGVEIVYPVHLNPNVQVVVKRILAGYPRVHLIKPLDYVSFVELMGQAYLILTDSGGIQEEATALGKPVLVMRKVTERTEAVMAGGAKLVGVVRNNIVAQAEHLLNSRTAYKKMTNIVNPYGTGKAAEAIVTILAKNVGTLS
jgi:UDP-N-acetylglucosamine 2-epimerase (non-hydrolysing)